MRFVDKRRMCPSCRAFITTSDRVCPYCKEPVVARAVDARNPGALLGGLIPAAKFTTSLILVLNIGVYLASMYGGEAGQKLIELGDKDRFEILIHHEWWRLITAGFLHGGLLHIGMNMWVLNDLGAEVERTFGTARFLIFYFAGTVCGFLLSTFLSANPSLGASAGLFGLIGAMIAFGMRNRTEVGRQIRAFYFEMGHLRDCAGAAAGFSDRQLCASGRPGGRRRNGVCGRNAGALQSRGGAFLASPGGGVRAATAYSFWIVFQEFLAVRTALPSAV